MASDHCCGSSLFVSLPVDALLIVNQFLSPKDLCNLTSCCTSLYGIAFSDEIWMTNCEKIGILLHKDLVEWRKGFASYKALFRFLACVQPLIGIWVDQNLELGNVVYVMPGFFSIVGCRIIPQKLGPLGMEGGPFLWAPVFEIIGDVDGCAVFFLHGREKGNDYVYPGSFSTTVDRRECNVLLLGVEPRLQSDGGKLVRSKSFDHRFGMDLQKKISRSGSGWSWSEPSVPFSRLVFDDREKLLETVTGQIRLKLPDWAATGLLFPILRIDEESSQHDKEFLLERRSWLIHSYKQQGGRGAQCTKSKTLAAAAAAERYFGRPIAGPEEDEHAQLHEFLRSGDDAIGLTLHASEMELSYYRGWPDMDDSFFALHKLPVQSRGTGGHEYAGMWGGTFKWPPGKPGEPLFFLRLSYEESEGLLIGTKILEGTSYFKHPNGSTMFTANIDEPSQEPFPWEDTLAVGVSDAFVGEGITGGYGFRYPGSKPGSLFVIEGGLLLAFVWKGSGSVLTMQRIDLPELLKKGERVPALSPLSNF